MGRWSQRNATGPSACIVRYQTFNEGHVRREAAALSEAGYDVEAICVKGADELDGDRWGEIKVQRVAVPKTRGGIGQYLVEYTIWFVVCWWHLTRRTLAGRRPDVVQVSTLPDQQVFAAWVAKLFGARVVVFFKEPTAELVATKFTGLARRVLVPWSRLVAMAAARFADHAIAVSSAHRQIYLDAGLPPDRIGYVPNCPQSHHVASATGLDRPGRFVLLCHGTVEVRMGQRLLVDAMALAVKARPDLLLMLTGDGSDDAEVRRRIERLELDEWIEHFGYVSSEELARIMATAEVGVVPMLPSDYSHLVHTTKMFEFMLRDVPVIAGDLKATITDFPDGCEYFTAGDAASLAAAIVRMADDADLRDAVRRRGSAVVAETNWEALAGGYIEQATGQRLTERTS